MLEKMARIQIVGTREHLEATTATLAHLGTLHIEDAAKSTTFESLALDQGRARRQEDHGFLVARLDSLIQLLPQTDHDATAIDPRLPSAQALADRVRDELDRLAPTLQELARRRDELQAELLALPRYEAMIEQLVPLAAELRVPPDYDTLALFIDKRHRDALDLLRVEVGHLTGGQATVAAHDVDERTTAALVVYPHAFLGAVNGALEHENVTQVRLPKEVAGQTFHDARAAIERRRFAIEDELARIEDELAASARAWRTRLIAWRREINASLQGLLAQAQFAATAHTFVVEGWVPRRALAPLRGQLAREFGGLVVVEELPMSEDDLHHAPVALSNPPALKPFERLVRLLGTPRAGGFDPTILLAIFLPLFFGIIVGDIGYGALLLGFALWARRRFAANDLLRDLAQLLVYGSLWSIVWGILYGEVFGTLQYEIGLQPIWIPRTGDQIVTLFVFSIAVGAAHVVLGLLLGLWEAWRERHRNEVVAKIGMLVALCAIFGMVGTLTNFLPDAFFTPTIAALLVGIALLIVPLGPVGLLIGPLELVETLSNILSYLRLAAVGLASVYIALVANEMVGVLGNVVLGGIIALLLHALNFVILILSPSIQSLRLHYVEFFRHFYKAEGSEYRPFRAEA